MDFAGYSILLSSDLGSSLSYIIIFLLSILDTLFLIGTIFPGGLMVMVLGFLTVFTGLDLYISFFVVFCGGLIGDLLTYYFGTHGTNWFKCESKLLKLAYLEKGQKFFEKYGDKSIILGRFMGVVKAVIPFVAGLVKMDFKKFVYLNIVSSILWTFLYISIGLFIGKTVHSFYISREIKFFIIVLPFALLFVWLIFEYRNKILNLFIKK